MLRQPPQSFISTLKIEFEPFMHLKFGVIERSRTSCSNLLHGQSKQKVVNCSLVRRRLQGPFCSLRNPGRFSFVVGKNHFSDDRMYAKIAVNDLRNSEVNGH